MVYRCTTCKKGFPKENHLKDHLQSTGHMLRTEQRRFSQSSLPKVKVKTTCTRFRCCDCNRDFVGEEALMQHLRHKIHNPKSRQKKLPKILCEICSKSFTTNEGLRKHKASRVHQPLCVPIYCIGSDGCKKRFNSTSSMILHLESGSCSSGLTRPKLNEIIAQQDTENLITPPPALESTGGIGGSSIISDYGEDISTPLSNDWTLLQHNDSSSTLSTSWDILTPSESSFSLTPSEGSIAQSDNILDLSQLSPSTLFLCHLCPPTSNRFRNARDLDSHSRSPVHDSKSFHCPVALSSCTNKKLARRSFSTLSGLTMHVESGACGKKTFSEVLKFVNDQLKNIGFQEIRLVK